MANKNVVIFAIVAVVLIQIATIVSHWPDVKAEKPDFAALYGTAREFHGGEKPDYDATKIAGVDEAAEPSGPASATAPQTRKIDLLHPPFEALLFYPLAFLPYRAAYLVWFAINLVLLWLVPKILWGYLPRLQIEFQYIAIAFGTGLPVLASLTFGQDSILLLLLITLSYVSLEKGNLLRAGMFLGLCMFKFQVVLPIVLCMAIARRWKLIAGFLGTLCVMILVTVGVMGPAVCARYIPFIFRFTSHISAENSDRTGMMPNLRGLLSFLLDSHASKLAISAIVIAMSVLVVVAVWRSSEESLGENQIAVEFSTYVIAATLVSYHLYVYNSVVLLLPLLLIANEFADPRIPRIFRYGFAVAAINLYIAPSMVSLRISMPISAGATVLLFGLVILYRARQNESRAKNLALENY